MRAVTLLVILSMLIPGPSPVFAAFGDITLRIMGVSSKTETTVTAVPTSGATVSNVFTSNFTFTMPAMTPGVEYTVTAQESGYLFSPQSYTVIPNSGQQLSADMFTAGRFNPFPATSMMVRKCSRA
jgi:hypothetical protein